ncbi:MAG TPA: TonB family protein [Terriglobales bacterium]|nr:TonB family protein [Terriglobales bacterium]
MASILTPPERPSKLPTREGEQLALWGGDAPADAELTPHLLLQLEDDLERSRRREAAWISVVVHLMVVLFLVFTPKMFPSLKGVVLISPADLMRNQQMTYLDLPPDMQKEPKIAPKTNVLSDKNRIAETRHLPTLDKKTLEELKRAGSPGIPAAPGREAQMASPQNAQSSPPQQNQAQGQQMAQIAPPLPAGNSQLAAPQSNTPKFPGNLAEMMSPGAAIEQAERAVAARRSAGMYGTGGDYGVGPGGTRARALGNLEVLTDTQGVDFGPYLERVLQAVRMNWYAVIPEEARAPLMKRGKVSIEFVILRDGKVAGMKIVGPSGDVSLDRAAWAGITASVPFAPLPGEFHGPYLALRFHFYYNPAKGDLD